MITEGILNINKPQNMTSHDVVAIARRALGIKKIGHTGTLDPMATGVLPICIGKSTRVIEYLDMDIKKYSCDMVLGMQTDTQDIWGNTVDTCPVSVTADEIMQAFNKFKGVIDQKPPMYSAIKVNGKRLYEYAREGISVDVKPRKVYIKSLVIDKIDLESERKTVSFTVECTKGTYIRTICQDVGEEIGCFGTLSRLERSASGIFTINDAITIEDLKSMTADEIKGKSYRSVDVLHNFGKISLNREAALSFINGRKVYGRDCRFCSEPKYKNKEFYLPIREELKKAYNVYGNINDEEEFLGVAVYNEESKELKADKVFFTRG